MKVDFLMIYTIFWINEHDVSGLYVGRRRLDYTSLDKTDNYLSLSS